MNKPKWRTAQGKRHKGDMCIDLSFKTLGCSSAIAAGDIIRRAVIDREERQSQMGVCRTMFLDGLPVRPEDQLLDVQEIRRKRRNAA